MFFQAMCMCFIKYFLYVRFRLLAQWPHCSPMIFPDHICCSFFKYPSSGMILLFLLSPSSSFILSMTDISLRTLEYGSISLFPFLFLSSLSGFVLSSDFLFCTAGFHDGDHCFHWRLRNAQELVTGVSCGDLISNDLSSFYKRILVCQSISLGPFSF